MLPGSRFQEIESFGPILIEAAKRLHQARPALRFVLPVAAKHLEPSIRKLVSAAGMDDLVEIREHKPMSREKRWAVTRLIERPIST